MRSLLCLLVAFAAACDPEYEDPIFIAGTALDAEGRPLAHAEVRLSSTSGAIIDHPTFASLQTVHTGQTDPDGRFTLVIPYMGISTPALGGSERLRVELPIGPRGEKTWIDFKTDYDAEMPLLRHISFTLVPEAEGYLVNASTQEAPEGALVDESAEIWSGGQLAWRLPVVDGAFVPPKALHREFSDLNLRVRRRARGHYFQPNLFLKPSKVTYAITHLSGPTPLEPEGPALPPSRSASCTVLDAYRDPIDLVPCPATDGSLETALLLDRGVVDLVIRLNSELDLARVVVRGLVHQSGEHLIVEGAREDGEFEQLAEVPTSQSPGTLSPDALAQRADHEEFLDVQLNHATPVQRVRLSLSDAYGEVAGFSWIREVSLWPASP